MKMRGLQVGMALDNGVGALTFGVDVGGGRVSWPSGPTWLLYGGDDSHCAESVPVLLRRGTFCDAFLAQARVFRTYHSWVLSLMLRRVRHDVSRTLWWPACDCCPFPTYALSRKILFCVMSGMELTKPERS